MSAQESRRISYGRCALCEEAGIAKRTMRAHLSECPRIAPAKGGKPAFQLVVEYPYDKRYWLHLEAEESATLRGLDAFLRETWLECCGHMSAFTVAERRYVAPEAGISKEYGEQPMRAKLKDVLSPGLQCAYEYDFGSTTELVLNVAAHGAPKTRGGAIRLLAQNEPPVFVCAGCGTPAAIVCLECQEEADGPKAMERIFFCDACIGDEAKHAHDDEAMQLPVVNSPRMGVCGYTG